MKQLSALCAVLVAAFIGSSQAQTEPPAEPLRAAVECTPRAGLANVFAKLKSGKPVKIAYLGGSITAQGGWRVQSLKWLKEKFPTAQIEEINAAIGGTGSDLGAFRLEKDVLRFKPDLLFVEFAVNDANTPSEKIRKAMEGIVRQTWRADPDCDICFVYTLVAASFPGLQEGKLTRSASVMEEVADHYQIPTIHFGLQVAALAKQGKLVGSSPDPRVEQVAGDELNEAAGLPKNQQDQIVFSKDGVHPYLDTGHVLYTQALIRALTQMESLGTAGQHTLGTPLEPGNWENARLVDLSEAVEISRGPSTDPVSPAEVERFANRLPGIVKLRTGDTLTFRFSGTDAHLYALRGPDSGSLEVSIDGVTRKIVNFDKYSGSQRLVSISLAEKLPNATHEIKVTPLADPVAKGDILAGKGLEEWKAHPEKFTGSTLYAGALLLLGDLLPAKGEPSAQLAPGNTANP